jgi:hypothetical protein
VSGTPAGSIAGAVSGERDVARPHPEVVGYADFLHAYLGADNDPVGLANAQGRAQMVVTQFFHMFRYGFAMHSDVACDLKERFLQQVTAPGNAETLCCASDSLETHSCPFIPIYYRWPCRMIVQMQSLLDFSYGTSPPEIEGDDDSDWEMADDEDNSDDDFSDWDVADEDSGDDNDENYIIVVYDSSGDDDNLPSNSERFDPNRQRCVLCNQVYAQNPRTGYGNLMKHLGSPIHRNTFLPEWRLWRRHRHRDQ